MNQYWPTTNPPPPYPSNPLVCPSYSLMFCSLTSNQIPIYLTLSSFLFDSHLTSRSCRSQSPPFTTNTWLFLLKLILKFLPYFITAFSISCCKSLWFSLRITMSSSHISTLNTSFSTFTPRPVRFTLTASFSIYYPKSKGKDTALFCSYYLHMWIKNFLKDREQRVAIRGTFNLEASVEWCLTGHCTWANSVSYLHQ